MDNELFKGENAHISKKILVFSTEIWQRLDTHTAFFLRKAEKASLVLFSLLGNISSSRFPSVLPSALPFDVFQRQVSLCVCVCGTIFLCLWALISDNFPPLVVFRYSSHSSKFPFFSEAFKSPFETGSGDLKKHLTFLFPLNSLPEGGRSSILLL